MLLFLFTFLLNYKSFTTYQLPFSVHFVNVSLGNSDKGEIKKWIYKSRTQNLYNLRINRIFSKSLILKSQQSSEIYKFTYVNIYTHTLHIIKLGSETLNNLKVYTQFNSLIKGQEFKSKYSKSKSNSEFFCFIIIIVVFNM